MYYGIDGTDKQRLAYRNLIERWEKVGLPQISLGMDCWMVHVKGETGMEMWLGIEPDGYTHS
jgi:hypothetical protein